MKKYLVIVGLVLFNLGAVSASAQSSLQNTDTGIQPQTQQTQPSTNTNTQGQTGSVQESNGQGALTQSGSQPLGVVSDPKQQTPSNVVQPSPTLKTDISDSKPKRQVPLLLISLVIVIVFIIFAIRVTADATESKQTGLQNTKSIGASAQTVSAPKPVAPELTQTINKPKKKKQTRKQRRKK